MKLEYDSEGRCKLEDKLLTVFDRMDEIDFPDHVHNDMYDLACQTVWELGQNDYTFQAPRLQAMYNEFLAMMVQDAERAAGWDPNP